MQIQLEKLANLDSQQEDESFIVNDKVCKGGKFLTSKQLKKLEEYIEKQNAVIEELGKESHNDV